MRVPRNQVLKPGSYFHMMWRAHNKEYILQSRKEKLAYLRALRNDYMKNCKDRPFKIQGYTIMSNHAHVNGRNGEDSKHLSGHMRRAHSRFGLGYNKRHDRLGKVAHDRPKIKASQDESYSMEAMLYDHCNPVRAKIIKTATDIRWRLFSTARYMCFGEVNEFTCMIDLPDWYMKLGSSAKMRQRKYRQMLEKYQIDKGLKPDPKRTRGYFIGSDEWTSEQRAGIRRWRKAKEAAGDSEDPPDTS